MNHPPIPPPDWYPVTLDPARGEIIWYHLPDEPFLDPFFEDTIRKRKRTAAQQPTPFDFTGGTDTALPSPAAFFFHASRCGSTLLMQLLGLAPASRAIAEPPIIDQILNLPSAPGSLLPDVIRSYARSSGDTPVRLFVKLDSWHIAHAATFARLFPDVPRFFLYREPSAILASHRALRGSQMVPGLIDATPLGIDPAAVNPADLEGYAEKVLSRIFAKAIEATENNLVTPIAYSQLPDIVWNGLADRLGLTGTDWSAAKKRSEFDAKHPHSPPRPPDQKTPIRDPDLQNAFGHLESLRKSLGIH